jgi:hypothetical protein
MTKFINITIMLFIVTLTLSSCSSLVSLPNEKKIDKRLVGNWQGSEIDKQIIGMKKEWKMVRNNDGTFSLDFKTNNDGDISEFTENGNWWVEGNKFYEYHEVSGKTDTYLYSVLNKDQIQFEMLNTGVDFDDKNYTFIDTRINEKINNNKVKDGLSIESAIKVKSVSEEYDYIRKNCSNCKPSGQSLIKNNGKPYDVIRVINQDGKEVSYYFDISSFYGKW